MKQIFTKAQLVVLWISGLFICLILNIYATGFRIERVHGIPLTDYPYYHWIQGMILPIVIIATLLIITLAPKKKKPL